MRTAILVAALLICDCIAPGHLVDMYSMKFASILLVCFMLMDFAEFIFNIGKRNGG